MECITTLKSLTNNIQFTPMILIKYKALVNFSIVFIIFLIGNINFAQSDIASKVTFLETSKKTFPIKNKNLRKWDSPVIADLDHDGYLDMLINDHGYGVQVYWNDSGKFNEPFDIIMGDLHGVTIGDFDFDGNFEVIMARGGGSGSNARNSKMFRVTNDRKFHPLPDFKEPLALMRGRTVKFYDADNDGDLDLINFAFPDSNKKGESENYIYKNDGSGQLALETTLPAIKADGQKTLLTDINNDNIVDILIYGNGPVKAFMGTTEFNYKEITTSVFPEEIEGVTSVNEIDFDNDGDYDLYLTRSNSFEIGETFYDEESNILGFYTKRGVFNFNNLETGDILELENFQSQWPNNDTYFLGETGYDYIFEGETHSGKDIKLINSDALGFPDNTNFENKTGFYIGYVGNDNWRISGYLWAPATGIIHGVKNYPKYEHKLGLSDIMLENRNGTYFDITKKMNLYFHENNEASAVADFNNDGLSDLLVIKRGDLISENKPFLFLNNGKSGFESVTNDLISRELGAIGMAVEALDFNNDGRVDVVIGNERGKWHLFENTSVLTQFNNFIIVKVNSSPKENTTSLGAKVELEACGEKQTQRVGSNGSQYSQGYNNYIHFGVGTCKKNIDVKVTWPNGEVKKYKILKSNTLYSTEK